MSSRTELEQQLDKLPPRPYKPTAGLRELHRLFHQAAEIDEGVPPSVHSLDTDEEILVFVESIKPTNLAQALEMVGEIEREATSSHDPGSALVLKLALRIYLDHNPPDKVDHSY